MKVCRDVEFLGSNESEVFFLVFCLGSNSERILTLNSLKMSGYNFGEYMISMKR